MTSVTASYAIHVTQSSSQKNEGIPTNLAQKILVMKQQGYQATQRVQFRKREPPLRPTQDPKRFSQRIELSPPPLLMDAKGVGIARNPRQAFTSARMMTTRTRVAALSDARSHTQNLAMM
jgi:hypothetical protein